MAEVFPVGDKLKTRVILGLAIFSVILMLTNLNSCGTTRSQERKWRFEMAQRLDSEEKANKAQMEQSALGAKLQKCGEKLQESEKALDAAQKALLQEQAVNANLRGEIDKLNKLKDALEEDLKTALAANAKAAKPRK